MKITNKTSQCAQGGVPMMSADVMCRLYCSSCKESGKTTCHSNSPLRKKGIENIKGKSIGKIKCKCNW